MISDRIVLKKSPVQNLSCYLAYTIKSIQVESL